MSEVKVNKISPRTNCGTVQLGDSGDTITIPAGATITNNGTQTGFGRTGTVNWDTTAKTASFTSVSGNGYFVNTTSGAITVTLPATPSAGDIVALQDYAGTWETNNVTIARNGSNIGGIAVDATLSTSNQSITLVYVDGTRGWQTVNDSTQNIDGAEYIIATGGTVTCCGDYKIHTFTGPGTFTVTSVGNSEGSNEVSYMVVAGGGAGGRGATGSSNSGAGGGAGGFREGKTPQCTYTSSPLACTSGSNNGIPVTAQGYPIVIGAGGTAAPFPDNFPTLSPAAAGNGNPSSAFSITSTAGGGGANRTQPQEFSGAPGGSGGGAISNGSGGTGNTPPVSPPQGNPGGTQGAPTGSASGTGGGGATVQGADFVSPGPTSKGTDGGAGATTSINGSSTAFAGGGGGGSGGCVPTPAGGGAGGAGGGGTGSANNAGDNTAGTANTGGGGGGGGGENPGSAGKNGGSGIVIIRYKYQ
jgi:hypothetical protein